MLAGRPAVPLAPRLLAPSLAHALNVTRVLRRSSFSLSLSLSLSLTLTFALARVLARCLSLRSRVVFPGELYLLP
jgi:hypothetical protein